MPSPRFKIKQSADGQFVVALYAANNECLCVTETYTTLQSAERAVDAIRNAAQRADVVYDSEKKKPTGPPPHEQLPATVTDSSVPSDSGTDPSGTTPPTTEQPPTPEPNPFSDLPQQ